MFGGLFLYLLLYKIIKNGGFLRVRAIFTDV